MGDYEVETIFLSKPTQVLHFQNPNVRRQSSHPQTQGWFETQSKEYVCKKKMCIIEIL